MRYGMVTMLLVTVVACAPPAGQQPAVEEAPTAEADRAALDDLRQRYVAGHEAADVDAIMDAFAADAVYMPPNEPALAGKGAIRATEQAEIDQFDVQVTLSSVEVIVADDWAFDRGTYDLTLAPKTGGESIRDDGKYVTICQRQADGSWKIARVIWNSDNPPPTG